ncbi:MAG: hypothetical protein IPF72_17690 [Chitinophagaceae bacterium]|nr:hypothetical protein [Chitinophagaceae bacterium]
MPEAAAVTGSSSHTKMPDHVTHKIVSNLKECHMLHFFCKSFISASLLLFLSAAAGCKTENQALTAYKSFTFDTTVMNRLPLYDSLAFAILRKIQLISLHIDDENAYHAFRYMPASAEAEVFKKLPRTWVPKLTVITKSWAKNLFMLLMFLKTVPLKYM